MRDAGGYGSSATLAGTYEMVRFYDRIRTAHLERVARQSEVIMYRRCWYDFDAKMAAGIARRVKLRDVFSTIWRIRPKLVEINEPGVLGAWPLMFCVCLAVLAVRIRYRTPSPRVVMYAIENADCGAVLSRKLHIPEFFGSRIYGFVCRFFFRMASRVAFGTDESRRVYGAIAPKALELSECAVFEPLLSRRLEEKGVVDSRVVYLGAFEERKGVSILLDAWPEIVRSQPDAALVLVGTGALLQEVERFANSRPEVTVIVDPPRSVIFDVLESSRVLVLPSRTTVNWREQVGLPIVEGLAYGCEVVTTKSTGLAGWLATQGHAVLPENCDAAAITNGVVASLRRGDRGSEILCSLPHRDGRIEADEWLCRS